MYERHAELADRAAHAWHIPGADADDVRQEARIALWEACRAYDADLGVPFPVFARIVIARRLRDALRNASRGKHRLLTDAHRDHDVPTSQDEIIQRRAELRALVGAFQQMSLLEQDAIRAIADGRPYSDVGEFRQVDNAVQRGRRKLRSALAAESL